VRQIAITDFGHEKPTLLLTNQLRRSAPSLIEFYARRMLIETASPTASSSSTSMPCPPPSP